MGTSSTQAEGRLFGKVRPVSLLMASAARIQALRSNRNKMLETIYGSMSRMRLRGSKIGVPRILRSGALSEIGGLPMSQRKMISLGVGLFGVC